MQQGAIIHSILQMRKTRLRVFMTFSSHYFPASAQRLGCEPETGLRLLQSRCSFPQIMGVPESSYYSEVKILFRWDIQKDPHPYWCQAKCSDHGDGHGWVCPDGLARVSSWFERPGPQALSGWPLEGGSLEGGRAGVEGPRGVVKCVPPGWLCRSDPLLTVSEHSVVTGGSW